jgi:hypothetical protein
MGIFDKYSKMFDPYQGGWKHRQAEQEQLERSYERQGSRPDEQAPDPLVDEVNRSKMMDVPTPQPTDWASRLGMTDGRLPLADSRSAETNIWGAAAANQPIGQSQTEEEYYAGESVGTPAPQDYSGSSYENAPYSWDGVTSTEPAIQDALVNEVSPQAMEGMDSTLRNTNNPNNIDKTYNALMNAEHRGALGSEGYDPWIRTKAGGGSSAYGPVQMTGGKDSMVQYQLDNLGNTGIDWDNNEVDYMNRFSDQAGKFLKYGAGDYKNFGETNEDGSVTYDGLTEDDIKARYEYGGTGDLTSDSDKAMYDQVAKKLMTRTYEDTDGSFDDFIPKWRGETEQNDPEYYNTARANY